MKTVPIEILGRISAAQETALLDTLDAALSSDAGTAAQRHLAEGRPVYFRDALTPPGHVIRKHPDGSCQLVRFTADGSELPVSEPAAASHAAYPQPISIILETSSWRAGKP